MHPALENRCDKNDRRQLCEFRRLEHKEPQIEPSPRAEPHRAKKATRSWNSQQLLHLQAEPPLGMLQAILDRELRVALAVGTVHWLQEEVRKVEQELAELEAEIEALEDEEETYEFVVIDLDSLSEEQLKAHAQLLDEQVEQAPRET